MFPSLADVNPPSFTSRSDVGQCSPLPPVNTSQKQNDAAATDDETEDEIKETLKKLSKKFGLQRSLDDEVTPMPIVRRRTTEYDETSNEAFKSKSKIQQEFLNTDAIYIAAYSTLCLAYRGEDTLPWVKITMAGPGNSHNFV
ncbi:hypothetical protein OSTOST_24045 [Ostertagia ostertagi]